MSIRSHAIIFGAMWIVVAMTAVYVIGWWGVFFALFISFFILFFGLTTYLGRWGFTGMGFTRMSETELSKYNLDKASSIMGLSLIALSFLLLSFMSLFYVLGYGTTGILLIGALLLIIMNAYFNSKWFKKTVRIESHFKSQYEKE